MQAHDDQTDAISFAVAQLGRNMGNAMSGVADAFAKMGQTFAQAEHALNGFGKAFISIEAQAAHDVEILIAGGVDPKTAVEAVKAGISITRDEATCRTHIGQVRIDDLDLYRAGAFSEDVELSGRYVEVPE